MNNQMYCMQCQETAGNIACTKAGVCGTSADLANMQDLLIYVTKGLSEVTTKLRKENKEISKEVNHLITLNLFTTITNANFDDDVFYSRVKETLVMKNNLLKQLSDQSDLSKAATWNIEHQNIEDINAFLKEKAE